MTEGKQSFLEKMKKKWGLNSLFQVILIMIVFALTGSSVLFLKGVIFKFLGIEHIEGWQGTGLYLLLIFPLYQILLLVYGFLFGQFAFFWEKEKKLGRAIKRLFVKSKG